MKTKNYLFVLPSDLMGGAEYTVLKLVKFLLLDPDNHVKLVFMTSLEGEDSRWDIFDGSNLVKLKAKRELFGIFYLIKYFFLNRIHYDFVFTTHTHINAFVSLLRACKILISDVHVSRESTNVFSWFKGIKLQLVKCFYILYRNDMRLICQNKKMARELIENVPSLKNNYCKVLPNPIDCDFIINSSKVFPSYNFDNKFLNIVSVGRLVPEKGFDVLIRALSFLPLNFRLYIIGSGSLEQDLVSLVKKYDLSGRVFFLGNQPNPFPYMKIADICVLSSRLEGFPNVLHEMMVLSNKVVTTRCVDLIDTIPGIVKVNVDDPTELSKQILYLADLDYVSVSKMVNERFTYINDLTVSSYIDEVFF